MITNDMLEKARAIAPILKEDALRQIMAVAQEGMEHKPVVDEGTKLSVRHPTMKEADHMGNIAWCRSGVWMNGKLIDGPPVDATHWRWTDHKKHSLRR